MNESTASGSDPHTDPAASVNVLQVGTRLQEFEIRSVIGEGGFGIVYAAHDRTLDREVAIKEYMPSQIAARAGRRTVGARSLSGKPTYEAGLRSFVEEARLLAQFKHPALVEVLRYWEENGTAYIAMPLYTGRTLKELVTRGDASFDERSLKALLAPLLDALDQLHRLDVFHRDISPDNVFVLPDGNPVLLDLGSARRIVGEAADAPTAILKPGYTPLEQYDEESSTAQGPWTDLYSLCAIAYFAIAGRSPPPSVARTVKDPIRPLAEFAKGAFSTAFLDAIHWGLAVRPQDRPQDADALRQRLGLPAYRAPTPAQVSQPSFPGFAPEGVITPTLARASKSNAASPAAQAPDKSSRTDVLADALSEALSGARAWRTPKTAATPDPSPADRSAEANSADAGSKTPAQANAGPLTMTGPDPGSKRDGAPRPEAASNSTAPTPAPAAKAPIDANPGGARATQEPIAKSVATGKAGAGSARGAAPPSVATAAMPQPSRRRAPAFIVGAVAVIAIATVAWLLLGETSAPSVAPTVETAKDAMSPARRPEAVGAAPVESGATTPAATTAGAITSAPAGESPAGAGASASGTLTPATPDSPNTATLPSLPPPVSASAPGAPAPAAARSPAPSPATTAAQAVGPATSAKRAPAQAPAAGTVRLTIKPWAEIHVDGVSQGVSPPLKRLRLPPGKHEIELRNAGAVARYTVTVRDGKSVAIEHRF